MFNFSKTNCIVTIFLIVVISLLLIIMSLSFGTIRINIFNISNMKELDHNLLILRCYKTLMAFTVGGTLSIAGAGYQSILKNPLAEPYILGISGGAGVGAAVSILLNLSAYFYLALPLSAFLGSIIVLLIVLLSVRSDYNSFNQYNVMMSGIAVNTICTSILMLIISFSDTGKLNNITWWMLGSLEFTDAKILFTTLFIVLISAFIMFLYGKQINVLSFGDEFAYNRGISAIKLSIIVLCISSLITSFVVSISGIIGFVGFIVPHIVRNLINNNDNRIVFPLCFYFGGIFLIFCDIILRVIPVSHVIPIGVVTSMIGAPIFIFILNKRIKNE